MCLRVGSVRDVLIPIPKIEKFARQNLKFDFDFQFWGSKFEFKILKIDFSNSFRIWIWDLKI